MLSALAIVVPPLCAILLILWAYRIRARHQRFQQRLRDRILGPDANLNSSIDYRR